MVVMLDNGSILFPAWLSCSIPVFLQTGAFISCSKVFLEALLKLGNIGILSSGWLSLHFACFLVPKEQRNTPALAQAPSRGFSLAALPMDPQSLDPRSLDPRSLDARPLEQQPLGPVSLGALGPGPVSLFSDNEEWTAASRRQVRI